LLDHQDLVERTELLSQEPLERRELLEAQEDLDVMEPRERPYPTLDPQDLPVLPVRTDL